MKWVNLKLTCLSIAVTTVAAIISFLLSHTDPNIRMLIIAVGIIGVVGLNFLIAAHKLFDACNQVKRVNFLRGIPEVIIFKSRTDKYILSPGGDTTLIWDFEIKKKKNSNNTYIDFPIFYNGENIPKDPIKVIYMMKNNKKAEQAATYIKRKQGKLTNGKQEIEGCIHVPLCPQNYKEKSFHILIKIILKQVNEDNDNYVTIDIPYLTENIKVIVKTEKDLEGKIKIDTNFFNVKEKNGQNIDYQETADQSKRCVLKNNQILWKAKYPKLGYSYTIKYRIDWPSEASTSTL